MWLWVLRLDWMDNGASHRHAQPKRKNVWFWKEEEGIFSFRPTPPIGHSTPSPPPHWALFYLPSPWFLHACHHYSPSHLLLWYARGRSRFCADPFWGKEHQIRNRVLEGVCAGEEPRGLSFMVTLFILWWVNLWTPHQVWNMFTHLSSHLFGEFPLLSLCFLTLSLGEQLLENKLMLCGCFMVNILIW